MKINFGKLRKVNWYIQGTQSKRYFTLAPSLAVQKNVKIGLGFIISSGPNHWQAFINPNDYFRLAKKALDQYKKDRNYLKKYYSKWKKLIMKLERKINQVRKLNVRRVSDQELVKTNKELGKLAYDYWLNQFFIDIFDPNADIFIERELQKINPRPSPEEIAILLRPDQALIYGKYQHALLNSSPSAVLDRFYFINSSYAAATPLTKSQIEHDLKHLDKRNKIIKKSKIIKKYGLNKWQRDFFSFFAFLAFWRDERKAMLQKTVFALDIMGREIARRSKLSWEQVSLCPPHAVEKIPVSRELINFYRKLAIENHLMIYNPKTKRHIFFDKKTCNKLMSILEPKARDIKQIKGRPASPGIVKGRVRIVRGERDFKKFRENEILITAMTRPEFMPIIRKAKAIITDEGGVTCHAAIVSREMKKPCIIGTKIATKVLKDGDLVEVDAEKGIVKVLKKSL